MNYQLNTPVLFLIFNRPDTTQLVFNKIKLVKPKYLFVAADGPRLFKKNEIEKCIETRKIIDQVDWDCEIKTLFREENKGCRNAVSEAISWFFNNVDEGIILEDDVLPSISFFRYCEELLDKYRTDVKVFQINGTNYLKHELNIESSYFFSKYPFIWGWASWKRAWKHYDINMQDLPLYDKTNYLKAVLKTKQEQKYFRKCYREMYYKKHNTWDTQWIYAIMKNNGLSITPTKNLTINIGTQNQPTHSFLKDSIRDNKKLSTINFPIKHPNDKIKSNYDTDIFENYRGRSFSRIFRLIKENGIFITCKYTFNIHLKPYFTK